jgi:hypothetical protein
MGSTADLPRGAGGPIEHPGRNLQPAIACALRQAAAENFPATLLNYLMDVNQASCPWMPRVKKLALLGPVGVLSSRCTTRVDRIRVLTGNRRIRPTSTGRRYSRRPNPGRGST